MDKQSSKKPFFIMPEWAWAIVVGMFMLLLFLNHVIPGHAANLYPQTPDQLGYGANYVSHITVKGGELYVGGTYIANVGLILQESEERIAQFESDAAAALNSLFSQIPKDQTYFALADDSAYGSVLVWLRSFLDDRDIQYSEIIIDYDDPLWYPQQWPDNWRDAYSETICSLGPYSVYVYVRKTLLAPSPTPEPSRPYYFVMYYRPYGGYESVGYYIVKVEGTSVGGLVPVVSSPVFDAVSSAYSVDSPFRGFVFLGYPSIDSGSMYVYFGGSQVSISYAFLGTSLPSGSCEDIAVGKTFYTLASSRTLSLYTNSNGLNCLRIQYSADNFVTTGFYKFDVPSYKSVSPAKYNTNSVFNANDVDVKNPYYQALIYGLTGDIAPTLNPEGPQPTSTPSPSPSPVPLPTSGESVHVILPTGTPSPTPPFTVPGGSDGDPGSGSPGTVGSGISAAQSSGILSYFSSFLSNNPALAFIAACFPAIPSEILYPLFILLFILMILAAIRLFVHFAGG